MTERAKRNALQSTFNAILTVLAYPESPAFCYVSRMFPSRNFTRSPSILTRCSISAKLGQKVFPMAFLLLAAIHAQSQDPVVCNVSRASSIAWEGAYNQSYAVQQATTISGDWQTVDIVSARSNGTQRWTDLDRTIETSCFYRVELLPETNGPFVDGFEIAGDWSDQLDPAWTSRVATGVWSGYRCYTVDNPAYAHESGRCVGITTPTGSAYLELPPVDFPTQIVYWARTLTGSNGLNLTVRTFDGLYWSHLSTKTFSSETYEMMRVPFGLSMRNQRIQFMVGGGTVGSTVLFDDVQIFTKQSSP